MRTAIFLSAILIAECINKDCVHENANLLSTVMAIFLAIDIVENVLN